MSAKMQVTGFEQFAVGQVFASAPRIVETKTILTFAEQYDTQPQHLSADAARSTIFGTLVASGWHTASLTMRMMLDGVLAGIGGRSIGLRFDALIWSVPVYPGDELRAFSKVVDVKPSRSKPDRGVVVVHTATRNQHGITVQEMTGTLMVLRSDAETSTEPLALRSSRGARTPDQSGQPEPRE